VGDEIKKVWPKVRLSVLEGEASDASPGLSSAQIVLGSRAAWRHLNFSDFELAAALLPDTELSLPEYRAVESTFATMRFLATSGPKRLLVQTYRPEHYVWQSMGQSLRRFYQAELAERTTYAYPPFTQLVRLTCEHSDERIALTEAKGVARTLSSTLPPGVTFTGPYPDYYQQVRHRYRFHLLLRYQRSFKPETLWAKLPDGILIDRHPWSILR
jgi:primosomal protein N' (replication factor Y)